MYKQIYPFNYIFPFQVRMVSQGAQTNGILNGRKLTKSLSEMSGGRSQDQTVTLDEPKT